MTSIDIEVISSERDSLSRTCSFRLGSRKVVTPSRAIGVTVSKKPELDGASGLIGSHFTPLGEAYIRVTLEQLNKMVNDTDGTGSTISSKLSLRLSQLRDAGCAPYILLSFVDSQGVPYNRLPDKRILDLIFDILWGTKGNSVIVPPILGALSTEKEYLSLITRLKDKLEAANHRNEMPLAAVIPAAYRLVAPHIVEEYWRIGCRFFAMDFESKKFGAYGYIIERLASSLSELSKRDKEPYILHAINAKQRLGRRTTMRVNDLLAAGYGFDTYGPSHGGRQRWIPEGKTIPPLESDYLFDRTTYGFLPVSKMLADGLRVPKNLGPAFEGVTQDTITSMKPDEIKNLCTMANIRAELAEIKDFPGLVEHESLIAHYSEKPRIKGEVEEMKGLASRGKSSQSDLEDWFQ